MKTYTLEKLPNEPIILGVTYEEWTPDTDIPIWADELYQLLDSVDSPVYYIGNLLEGHPWTVDEALKTASAVARGAKPVFHHSNVKEVLLVTNQALVNLGAMGLKSDIFGNVRVKVFRTADEAFAYARSQ